jgi:hypothetical protein
MPGRDPHPDNDLIDSMAKESGGSTAQNDSRGGNLGRDVGARAEQRAVEENLVGEEVDRARGSDNPGLDELKGDKTLGAMPTTPDR